YALREFGRCLIRNDRPDQEDHYERAAGLFERAVQMDPECPSNLFSLACSWFYGHRSDALKAKELLQRALELRPNHKGTIECLEEIEEHLAQENSDSPEGPPATD
ncbi:MAG: hypothetical protein P1V35_16585, partial [Planctomycetota bacterium]|nr:hypothetical protein [Planctomycetota bacterium]